MIVNGSPRPSVSKGFRAKKIFDYRGQFSRCLAAAIAVLKLFEVWLPSELRTVLRFAAPILEIEASPFSVTRLFVVNNVINL